MKHGDISNSMHGYVIAFRCVGFLVNYRDNNIVDKTLNFFMSKEKRATIDSNVARSMEFIYRNTEWIVDLVIFKHEYTTQLKNLLEDIPYSRVVVVEKESQITSRLLTGDITYYIDNDSDRRSLINNPNALSLQEISNMIMRGK